MAGPGARSFSLTQTRATRQNASRITSRRPVTSANFSSVLTVGMLEPVSHRETIDRCVYISLASSALVSPALRRADVIV